MNDKRRLKRASDPLVLLPTEGTGSSIFLSLAPSLSLLVVELYLLTSDAAQYTPRCLVYIHDDRYIIQPVQDPTSKEIRSTPCIIQSAQKQRQRQLAVKFANKFCILDNQMLTVAQFNINLLCTSVIMNYRNLLIKLYNCPYRCRGYKNFNSTFHVRA